MNKGIHRFNVGDISCTVLHETDSDKPVASLMELYVNAAPDDIQAALAEISHSSDEINSSMNILLIETDGQRILVDTGIGAPGRSYLLENLRAAGLSPETIDHIVLTHYHPDHIDGLFDDNGLVFSNAMYSTNRTEWDHWFSDATRARMNPETQARFDRMHLLSDRITWVKAGDCIAPGVEIMEAPGHTPGQIGLVISSQDACMWHLIDVLHREPQLARPNWHIRFDSDPEQAVETRRNLLTKAAEAQVLTFFYHLPFPGLGTVSQSGDAFRWHPINAAD